MTGESIKPYRHVLVTTSAKLVDISKNPHNSRRRPFRGTCALPTTLGYSEACHNSIRSVSGSGRRYDRGNMRWSLISYGHIKTFRRYLSRGTALFTTFRTHSCWGFDVFTLRITRKQGRYGVCGKPIYSARHQLVRFETRMRYSNFSTYQFTPLVFYPGGRL